MVAGGGGGLGIGRYFDDEIQQARGIVDDINTSGQVSIDNYDVDPGGPGGGWKPRAEAALDPHSGASLLEGSRGGHGCYNTSGIHGSGGFGGGK
jgi:anaplastic lymphoma kinase